MKNKIFIFLIAVLLPATGLKAQERVTIEAARIVKEGDTVFLNLRFASDVVGSDYKTTFVPCIYNARGEEKMFIDDVTISGRRKNIIDKRMGTLSPNTRVMHSKKRDEVVYEFSVPFRPWMQRVSVSVEKASEGCCELVYEGHELVLENQLLFYDVDPHFDPTKLPYELTELEKYDLENPFLHPMEDYGKRYEILLNERDKGSSVVFFKVGLHEIDMAYQGNSEVLAAISKAFELIESDPNATLKNIFIAGYASPEGSLAFNTRLAQRRAESVRNFIRSILRSPEEPGMFELYNGREDWDGLREKVDKSDMPEREQILGIIDSYTMEQEERKTKLKALGQPYRYMLENFYPPLRNAGYVQVYYEIDRRATVAAAVTDEHGRTTWVDPNSPQNRDVTLINDAIDMMLEGNYEQAGNILQTVGENARKYNLIGVCHMMLGDYPNAEEWFCKAIESGDPDAEQNMAEITLAKEVQKR